MKYIATFGAGQPGEGYYITINADTYVDAVVYMEKEFNGKYCMVYPESDWLGWVTTARANGFQVEEEAAEVTIGGNCNE